MATMDQPQEIVMTTKRTPPVPVDMIDTNVRPQPVSDATWRELHADEMAVRQRESAAAIAKQDAETVLLRHRVEAERAQLKILAFEAISRGVYPASTTHHDVMAAADELLAWATRQETP